MSKLQNLSAFTDLCLNENAQDAIKGGGKNSQSKPKTSTKPYGSGTVRPTTLLIGEEDGSGPIQVTTLMIGEEDGGGKTPITSAMIGEE